MWSDSSGLMGLSSFSSFFFSFRSIPSSFDVLPADDDKVVRFNASLFAVVVVVMGGSGIGTEIETVVDGSGRCKGKV